MAQIAPNEAGPSLLCLRASSGTSTLWTLSIVAACVLRARELPHIWAEVLTRICKGPGWVFDAVRRHGCGQSMLTLVLRRDSSADLADGLCWLLFQTGISPSFEVEELVRRLT